MLGCCVADDVELLSYVVVVDSLHRAKTTPLSNNNDKAQQLLLFSKSAKNREKQNASVYKDEWERKGKM